MNKILSAAQVANCITRLIPAVVVGLLLLPNAASAVVFDFNERTQHDFEVPPSPLFLGVRPAPNVMFVLDDSLSMDWHVVTPLDEWSAREVLFTDGGSALIAYDYPLPLPSAHIYWSPTFAPSQNVVDAWNQSFPNNQIVNAEGLWRMRAAAWNGLYYDPDRLYLPWQGVDSNGDEFGQADPDAIRMYPFEAPNNNNDPRLFDIDRRLSYWSTVVTYDEANNVYRAYAVLGTANELYFTPNGRDLYYVDNPLSEPLNTFIPHYYDWNDSNGNGQIDASDAHSLVEIDETANPDQWLNFANWFQYHRSRVHTIKSMVAELIVDRDNMRGALTTLHNDTRFNVPMALLNAEIDTGVKRNFLDKLFSYTPEKPATPIHAALQRAGQYFECKDEGYYNTYYPFDQAPTFNANQNQFGQSGAQACPLLTEDEGGACQRNVTFLVVDGFSTPDTALMHYNGAPPLPGLTSGQLVRNYNKPFGPNVTLNTDGDNNSALDGGAYADSYSNTVADVAMHYYERDLSDSLNGHQRMQTFAVKMAVEGDLTEDPPNNRDSFAWPNPSTNQVDDLRHTAYNGRGIFGDTLDPELVPRLQNIFDRFSNQHSTATNTAVSSSSLLEGTSIYLALYNTEEISGDLLSIPVNLDGTLGDPNWSAADRLDAQDWSSGREIITYNPAAREGIAFRHNELQHSAFYFGDLVVDAPPGLEGILNDNKLRPYWPMLGVSLGLTSQEIRYIRGGRQKEGTKFRRRQTVMGPVFSSDPVFVGRPSFDYPDDFESKSYADYRERYKNRRAMVYVGANDGMLHGFDAETGEEKIAFLPSSILYRMSDFTKDEWGPYSLVDGKISVIDAYLNDYEHCPGGPGDCWRTVLIGGFGAGAQGHFALDISDPTQFSEANAAKLVLWEFDDSGGLLDNWDPQFADVIAEAACLNLVTVCLNPAARRKIEKLYGDITDDMRAPRNYGHHGMGYSFGHANIVRLGDDRWYAVFGNGYNNTEIDLRAAGLAETVQQITLNSSDAAQKMELMGFSLEGTAYLYIVELETGALAKVFDTRTGNFLAPELLQQAGSPITWERMLNPPSSVENALKSAGNWLLRPNGLGTPAPVDEQSDLPVGPDRDAADFTNVEHIYAGDLMGSIWRFDVQDSDPDNWFIRYVNGAGNNATPRPIFNASIASQQSQPITVRPEVLRNPQRQGWITVFGTGRYLDVTDTEIPNVNPTQAMYGIWDQDVDTTIPLAEASLDLTDLLQRRIVDVVTRRIDTDLDGVVDSTVNVRVTSRDAEDPDAPDFSAGEDAGPIEWRNVGSNAAGTHMGWYLNLIDPGVSDSGGERVVARPRLRNGRILFSSLSPGESLCDGGGLSYVMQLEARDGSPPRFASYDLNGDGQFSDDDAIEIKDGVFTHASGRSSTVGMTGVPVIILLENGKELRINSGPLDDPELTLGNPGAFERSRSTWLELR